MRDSGSRKSPDLIVTKIAPMRATGLMRVTVKNIGYAMAGKSYLRVTDTTRFQSTGAPYNVVSEISP